MTHEWRAVDAGPQGTICHMWCANCGTLWLVADPHDPTRTNKYFVAGCTFELDRQGGLTEEPECPPTNVAIRGSLIPPRTD